MTKFKFSVVALATAVMLSGCGSESKSSTGSNSKPPTPTPTPPPAPTIYNWQLVNLRSEVPSSANADCAVYGVDSTNAANRIYAYRATLNVMISIHNAVGKLVKELKPNPYGTVSINYDDIPTGGYVTVLEYNGLNSNELELFSYSVEKPFVNHMVFNLRKINTYSCYYTGEGLPKSLSIDPNSAVDVLKNETTYVQTSYIDKKTNGIASNFRVPVSAPVPASSNVLVTLFNENSISGTSRLTQYGFAESSFIHNNPSRHPDGKTVGLSSDVVQQGLTISDMTLSNDSDIEVAYNNNIYQWQPLFQSSNNFSYITNGNPFSAWAMKINGTTANGSWGYRGMFPVSSVDKSVTPPTLTSFGASFIKSSSNASCAGNDCVETQGYTPADYSIQRLHVRSKTNNGENYYQTIISSPRNVQVLMESGIQNNSISPTSSDRVEIGLGYLSETSAATTQHFMSYFIDVNNLALRVVTDNFDVNGPVIQPSSEKTRYISLMGKTSVTLSNSVN